MTTTGGSSNKGKRTKGRNTKDKSIGKKMMTTRRSNNGDKIIRDKTFVIADIFAITTAIFIIAIFIINFFSFLDSFF